MNMASNMMDQARESWSLPWHALQRTLVRGVEAARCATNEKAFSAQKATQAAESWLGRARRRLEPTSMS
jgi:hypothetical protein